MLDDAERDLFDGLLEEALGLLPPELVELLDEVPLVVDDEPEPALLIELGMDPSAGDELCGLHTGTAHTERTYEAPVEWQGNIRLFRRGIIAEAGGWADDAESTGEERVFTQIMITLLHEIGHRFGLDDDDLDRLGYA